MLGLDWQAQDWERGAILSLCIKLPGLLCLLLVFVTDWHISELIGLFTYGLMLAPTGFLWEMVAFMMSGGVHNMNEANLAIALACAFVSDSWVFMHFFKARRLRKAKL